MLDRGTTHQWLIHDEIDSSIVSELGDFSHMLAHILYVRGHRDLESILGFPSSLPDYDPYLIPGMEDASKLIIDHLQINSKIAVYGDMDSDGISASAILYETLKALGTDAPVIIPMRQEGHGLADFRLEELAALGTKLVITVDTGIGAISEVEHAHKLGMEIIITDHHVPGPILPDCLIVNPTNTPYPFPYLSGAGVAYKLAQTLGDNISSVDDLVALGTIADIVPLRGENRTLALRGLDRMRQNRRVGLAQLMRSSSIAPASLDANSVAFYLAPKINSANRLSDPRIAFDLLITDDAIEAKRLTKLLTASNTQRQEMLASYLANVQIEDAEHLIIVMGDWPPGISGLVANKLTELHRVPAICASINEWNEITASARSIPTVNIMSLLENCAPYFRKFGGHSGAAGFICHSMKEFEQASTCLKEQARLHVIKHDPTLEIDAEIKLWQVNSRSIEQVNSLGPYGHEFPEPIFLARNVKLKGRNLMSEGKHMSATAIQEHTHIRAVFFHHTPSLELIDEDQPLDLVFNMSAQSWKGQTNPQLFLRDWKLTNDGQL